MVTGAPELAPETAQAWIARWDLQQQDHLPDREERFTALIDAVEAGAGARPAGAGSGLRPRLAVGPAAGPDSGRHRAGHRRRPAAARAGPGRYAGRAGLRFADCDLRTPGWTASLGLDRPADVAVSTTALHWLPEPALRAMYAELAGVLRPAGLLLDGDHFTGGEHTGPVIAKLSEALTERAELRRFPLGHAETWSGWWAAVAADPQLAGLAARRERLALDSAHHGSPSGWLSTHVDALLAAGFSEVGTLWQGGNNRILCAVAGG